MKSSKATAVTRSPLFLTVFGIWLVLIVSGFYILQRELYTPVDVASPPDLFPDDSRLNLDHDKPTLLLFVHPRCPCTRASLHEFKALLEKTRGKVCAGIVFTLPEGVSPGWEKGELWNYADSIPNLKLITDPESRETHRFGVRGSGHLLLYQPDGRLVFNGGITSSRGHEGENAGSSTVVRLVEEEKGGGTLTHTPVFGCSLFNN